MQTHTFIPQNWTRPLTGYRLAGWIESFGLLVGIGTIPLMVQLRWLAGWFWVVSLVSGLLMLGAGLYYLVRSGRMVRIRGRLTADSDQVLAYEQLRGRSIRVIARRKRQAVTSPNGGLPMEVAPQSSADPRDDIRQANILVILGIFILLPVAAVLLLHLAEITYLQKADMDNPAFLLRLTEPVDAQRVAVYLGGPALALWAVFEGLAFYAHWQKRNSGRVAFLGLFRSGSQVLAALLVWIFLGLENSIDWVIGLFAIAAGLTLLSAMLGTFTTPQAGQLNGPAEVEVPTVKLAENGLAEIQVESFLQPEAVSMEKETAVTVRAVFQIFRGKDGQFYFRLRAANNETILGSEGYRSKRGCQNGVQSVQQNAPFAERYQRCEASDGKYYFVLKAANHRVIGVSQRYTTPAGREVGIRAVMRVAPQAGVEEVE